MLADDPPRRRANKRRGHGTYEFDRPPIFLLVSRQSGEVRYLVREHSDGPTCLDVLLKNLTAIESSESASAATASAATASAATASAATASARGVLSHLMSDEWRGYAAAERVLGAAGLVIHHATVRHSRDEAGRREWARDDDGDGRREVHCNSCEGAGAGLRTYLRGFRGVHKYYLAEYVACYETMTNAKRITPLIIRKMCFGKNALHSNYT